MDAPKKDSPLQDHNRSGAAVRDSSSSGTSAGVNRGAGAVTALGTAAAPARAGTILQPGMLLAGRYTVQQMLGSGGMGAVYKAYDRDIDHVVALKVIRPDLAADPELLQRFKQELLLAWQISHKNVVRIFDVHDSGGLKFITMEYVEGCDLRSLLAQQGKLPPSEALEIMRQTCSGLAAAHAEGIIHRDLKPSNIMRDSGGRVVVMDFGLARRVDAGGNTQTGALIGTVTYMSPEQAKAEKLDARSDLFTVGLIAYELLTGTAPYQAESAVASLLKRTQERAAPPSQIDVSIPRSLSLIIEKCLEPDPNARYQNADELIAALDQFQGRSVSVLVQPSFPAARSRWIMIGLVAVTLIALAALTSIVLLRLRTPPSVHKTVTVLLADFDNSTSDSVFNDTLESSFALGMEGAPFINSYNRVQARKAVAQVRPGVATLDESNARLIAVREGISVVIGGSIAKDGDGYKIGCRAVDALNGKVLGSTEVRAANKSDVLNVVGKLAGRMRSVLGDTTPESVKLAQEETFTSSSLEAAHEYALAQDMLWSGKYEEAIPQYQRAIELDPNLGRAYSGVAAAEMNLGRRAEAEKYYKQALASIDRMSEREQFRTRGAYYLNAAREYDKAAEEFSALLKEYPGDEAGHTNLALAYFYMRDMPKALAQAERDVEAFPRGLMQMTNFAVYAQYAGDFETEVKQAREVLKDHPRYLNAVDALAMGYLGVGKLQEASGTYSGMRNISARGASMSSTGLADLAVYQGRFTEAITVLLPGIDQDITRKDNGSAASKLTCLASTYLYVGQKAKALEAAGRAVMTSNEDSVLFSAGRIYAETKQTAKLATLVSQLSSRAESEPQAYAKLLQGESQ
ncbi:MAG TPA: serine/threonine-protein kinase, partial [Terriglobales bacterium]|nr:serine/threonine-protein kinase [Terriglobales bacterium]